MSTTLDQLVRVGVVLRIEADIGPRRMPMRELFATQGFVEWASALPDSVTVNDREVSPAAEMNETASMFVSGKRVGTIMRNVMPTKHGIVRLFTPSFALIGWADGFQRLVLSRGVATDASHTRGQLTELMKQAISERKSLGLTWDGRHFYELFCFQG